MPSKIFDLPEIGLLTITKRKSSRSIRLGFDGSGKPRVSIPSWVPYQAGLQFAIKRADWITKHKPEETPHFKQADRVGKAHRLIFSIEPSNKTVQVRNHGTEVVVKYPANMQTSDPQVQKAAERGAKKALLKEGLQLLPQRLRILADLHDFTYKAVSVKQLKAKWGSCNQNHEITLNYYLMQLPWNLIDYVLIHELVHTEHLNHSEAFWKRFEQALPGAKKIRKELKTYKTSVIAT